MVKLTRFAPLVFVLLWSTGFVGAKYALPYADPFIFLSVRVLIAAALLFAVAALMKSPILIGGSAIRKSAVIGVFLHAAYLGGVFFAISQGVPAGVAAVITSMQPVFVSLLAIKFLGEGLRASQVVGLFLGLAGVVLVLGPSFENQITEFNSSKRLAIGPMQDFQRLVEGQAAHGEAGLSVFFLLKNKPTLVTHADIKRNDTTLGFLPHDLSNGETSNHCLSHAGINVIQRHFLQNLCYKVSHCKIPGLIRILLHIPRS